MRLTAARCWLARLARLDHIWLLLPLAFTFSYAAAMPIKHSDLFYMMLNGRLMAEQGVFPVTSDPFTYAPADPLFFNQPWLAQLLLWAAERAAGYPGVVMLHALALTVAFALLLLLVRRAGVGAPAAAGLTFLALLLGATNFSIRPQSFALLPFVLALALLRGTRPGQRWANPAMGLLSAVWANLHGTFPLGVVLAGAHWAGAVVEERSAAHPRVRHHLWLALAAALGTLLNPAGPLVWWYSVRASLDSTNRTSIWEWQPTTLAELTGQIAFGTLPVVVALFALARRRPRPTDLLLLGAFGWLALGMQRAVIWWGLLLPPLLAPYLAGAAARASARRELPALNGAILAVLAGLLVLSLPWLRPVNPLLASDLRTYLSADHPTGAVQYLQTSGARGKIFARMEWGGYLEWSLWPRLQVFLDARVEQHPPSVWRDYFAILSGEPGWDTLLDRYGADYLLVERRSLARLVAEADRRPAWRRIYEDDLSVLYARTA